MNLVSTYFGENLHRCRKEAGFSQEELGIRASLHRTEIGLLERGARMPRIDTVIKLATALELEPARLLKDIVWNPGDITRGAFSIKESSGEAAG
jgi:transcriptional regulator with XRE-family HTH domain